MKYLGLLGICKVKLLFIFIPTLAFAGISGLHPPMEIEPELLLPEIEGMVFVKGGCFEMGDTFGNFEGGDQKPVHKACVDDFYIGKYEVTQREWVLVMGNNPSYFKDCDNCPVEHVDWNDVQDFIGRLNRKGRVKYRLPTEAEWEYAARSGGKQEKFSGTSDNVRLRDYAWYDTNSDRKTHPVGKKRPNGLGLYDMSGNVSEWVSDWYGEGYYQNSPKDNPTGPSYGKEKVNRGGSWFDLPWRISALYRGHNEPNFTYNESGFRLALSLQ